ncbi:MAG: DUF7549 family protein, partial [Haloferacaceae archaeon]
LFAWLSALLPWNVTYSTVPFGGGEVSALFVRFPLFQVRFLWGVNVDDNVALSLPIPGWLVPGSLDHLSALAIQQGQSILVAYQVWAVGAAVFAVALALSVAYYRREERVEALAVDPVRLMGGLLGLAGLVLAVATYLLYTRGLPGIPIPIGVLFLLLFSGLLLTVERVDSEAEQS